VVWVIYVRIYIYICIYVYRYIYIFIYIGDAGEDGIPRHRKMRNHREQGDAWISKGGIISEITGPGLFLIPLKDEGTELTRGAKRGGSARRGASPGHERLRCFMDYI